MHSDIIYNWSKYNPLGLLIGPLPHINRGWCFVPDYSHPGVAERVRIEVDMIEDMCWDKRKL